MQILSHGLPRRRRRLLKRLQQAYLSEAPRHGTRGLGSSAPAPAVTVASTSLELCYRPRRISALGSPTSRDRGLGRSGRGPVPAQGYSRRTASESIGCNDFRPVVTQIEKSQPKTVSMPKAKKLDLPEENPLTRRLTGTFTVPPALCLGDVFNDKLVLDARHRGKQVMCGTYKVDERSRLCAPGTFKLQPFLFAGEDMKDKNKYEENLRYTVKFPNGDARPRGAPKCGFKSTDFARRDQYTNTIATEQARSSYRCEARILKKASTEQYERLKAAGFESSLSNAPQGISKIPLYDLVNRMPDLGLMAQKLRRDDRQGKYFFMAQRQKELGQTDEQKSQDFGFTGPKIDPRLDPLHNLQLHNILHAKSKFSSIDSNVWVSVILPDGKKLMVQLDEARTIVDKRPMTT